MNPTNDNDFAKFEGQFGFSQAPDPTFAEILRRRMDSERVAMPVQRATVLASPTPGMQVQKPAVMPPPSRRPIWTAVAVLLMFAVVGASLWSIRDVVLEGQYAGAPEVVLPVDASVTPGPDVELTSQLLAQPNSFFYQRYNMFDDVIVGSGPIGDGDEGVRFFGIDANTGEQLWEHHDWMAHFITFDGDVIYFVKENFDDQSQNETAVAYESIDPADTFEVAGILVAAVDLRSGSLLWESELPAFTTSFDEYASWSELAAGDGVVFIANWNTVVALDATTGAELWQVTTRLPKPSVYSGELVPTIIAGQLVLVGTDGYVLVIDPDSGQIVQHSQVAISGYLDRNYGVDVAPNRAGLVVVWRGFHESDGEASVTMLVDPQTGAVLSSVTTDSSSGLTAFAEDGSVAFVPNKWHSGNILMRILGRGGYTSFSLVWVDALDGEVRLRTDYARVTDWSGMVVTNSGEYVCYVASSLDCYDASGTRYTVVDTDLGSAVQIDDATFGNVVSWMQIADGRLYYATNQGIFVVDLP